MLDPACRRGPVWVIAVDGPAASGKGTLARRLAAALGFASLDTGMLYRRTGLAVLRAGRNPGDTAAAASAAAAVAAAVAAGETVEDPELRSDAVAAAASRVASMPSVRAALLEVQRAFARQPPGARAGAVLDGRDIGTVVCPGADVKLFVTAALGVRAARRLKELQAGGAATTLAEVLDDLERRDRRDSQRATAPLAAAPDAVLLDTSELDADAALAAAMAAIRARIGQDRA